MTRITSKQLSTMGMHVVEEGVGLDLVCGMEISDNKKFQVVHKGKAYNFCSRHCQQHFRTDPELYVGE